MTARFEIDDLPENMRSKIVVAGDCWTWTGAKNPKGYGSVTNGRGGAMLAHRKVYTIAVGSIPDGEQIDHLCENTSCVNPAHLEAVTPEEHRRRIGHADLVPVYAPEPQPRVQSPEEKRAWDDFFGRIESYQERYAAMSPEEKAAEDARRHDLHVRVGCSCVGRTLTG